MLYVIALLLLAPTYAVEAAEAPLVADSVDAAFEAALKELATASAAKREAAVRAFAALNDARVVPILEQLTAGQLYRRRSDNTVVVAQRAPGGYQLSDPVDARDLGTARRRDVRRLPINNALRQTIEALLAGRALTDPDAATRLAAATELTGQADSAVLTLAREQLDREPSSRVREALDALLAVALLQEKVQDKMQDKVPGSDSERIAAVNKLAGNPSPAVRQILTELSTSSTASDAVAAAAARSLRQTEQHLARLAMVETLFFGLSLGSVLVLAAMGLAITFGVMGVINMAHGELIMLGAYCAFVLQSWLPAQTLTALLLAIPLAFLVAGGVGVIIERLVIRHLYGRPLETLLATFGISLILQQAVRSVFSPLNRSVSTPDLLAGSVTLTPGLELTVIRLVIVVFSLSVFVGVLCLLRYSRLGLQIRAVAQNRSMARALGVRGTRIDSLTFGLGAGLAGVAGVALSQLTNVGPNMGQAYIIDSFLVVVFGGVGNLWGTLVGGLSIGVLNKVLEPYAGAVLAKIFVLVGVILFIQRRPQGLFPQRGRAAQS